MYKSFINLYKNKKQAKIIFFFHKVLAPYILYNHTEYEYQILPDF